MLTAKEVALYFLSKDINKELFSDNVVNYNGRKFYEGNLRLNKYLFLSQVVYLAKYDEFLFTDDFVAYDNGPVILSIMNSYGRLKGEEDAVKDEMKKSFLDKIYFSLQNATYEELIEISHDDPEWQRLSNNTYNAPVMNLKNNIMEYKKKYKGLLDALKI